MASSRFRSRLTLGQTVNRVQQRLQYYSRNPAPKRLQAGVVTAPKVARDAITGDNIVDGSVPGSKIESGSITADQIQAGSITAEQIQAGTITADNIAANTITAEQINARSIGTEELAIDAVHAENIYANAIRSEHIFAGAIDAEHIKANISLTSPVITGGFLDMTGVIRGTRIITNDIIGVGPGDLIDPANYPEGAPQLSIAPYIAIRPYVENPAYIDENGQLVGDLTSQLTLWQDGHIEITATSFEAMELNGRKFAARNHTHANRVSHGEAHNPTLTSPSDARLKKDVEPLAYGLEFINSLRPVQFKMIEGDGSIVVDESTLEPLLDEDGHVITKSREGKRTHFGLIAQELKQTVDSLGLDFAGHVIPDYETDPDGMQQIGYSQLVPPLILAVQQLAEANARLQETVALLQQKVQ